MNDEIPVRTKDGQQVGTLTAVGVVDAGDPTVHLHLTEPATGSVTVDLPRAELQDIYTHTEYVIGYADTGSPVPGAEPSRDRKRIERTVTAATERARERSGTIRVPATPKWVVLTRQVTDWERADAS